MLIIEMKKLLDSVYNRILKGMDWFFFRVITFVLPWFSCTEWKNSIEISNKGQHMERYNLTYLSDSCTTPIESDASAVTVSASSFSRCWACTNDWQICVAARFTLFQYLPVRQKTSSPISNNNVYTVFQSRSSAWVKFAFEQLPIRPTQLIPVCLS